MGWRRAGLSGCLGLLALLASGARAEETLPADAQAAFNAAKARIAAGDPAGALAQLQRTQQALERAFGAEHELVADVMQEQGNLQLQLGNLATAADLLQRSIALRERLRLPPGRSQAMAWQTLGVIHYRNGQDEQAAQAMEKSLALARATGASDADIATLLSAQAAVKSRQGRHQEALAIYVQAGELLERQPDAGRQGMASLLNNIAATRVRLGEYHQALAPLQRALALWEASKGPDSLEVAAALNNLGELHARLGEPSRAKPLLERSLTVRLKLLPPTDPEVLSGRNNLALTLLDLGELQAAAAQLRAAHAVLARVPDSPMAGALHNSLATLESKAGRPQAALQSQAVALDIARRQARTRPVELEISLRNLAALQLDAGLPLQPSLDLLQEALTAADPEQLEDGGAQTRLWLSVAHARAGRTDQAIFWGKLAVNAVQQQRAKLRSLEQRQQTGFMTLMPDIHGHLAGLLLKQDRVPEAQQVLQMLKEHEQSELLQRAGAPDPRVTGLPLDDREQALLREFAALQAKVGAAWREQLKRASPGGSQALASQRQETAQFLSALDRRLADNPGHRWALPPGAVQQRLRATLEQVGREAPESRPAALQYVLTGQNLYLLLSSPGSPTLVRQASFGPELRNAVGQARLMLATPGSNLATLQARLRSLHEVLIAPVREELARRKVRTLMVSANGELRYLPWAALYDGQRYLVQDFAVTGFHEGVDNPFARPPRGPWQVAGLGLSQATQDLPALPQVRAELNGLLRTPGLRGQIWMNGDFSHDRLRRLLEEDYNVLHVASHFRFVHGSTDQSSLFLGDGSRLSLADIEREDLRFSRLNLLVFSACETGLGGGQDQNGREIDGLGGLAQRRGASAVLMTLWRVSDEEMPLLMQAFYREWVAGSSKAEALRSAQAGLLTRALAAQRVPERAAHPYFWASVVLSGNWR